LEQATAVLLYVDRLTDNVETAVATLTHLQRIQADAQVCTAFQVVRLPTLILYNEGHEETARAFGNLNILELVRQAISTTDADRC
jgi:hypothetical protein